MGDEGEFWRDVNEWKRAWRTLVGVECPQCKIHRPKTNATILMPGWRCKVDRYQDPRPRYVDDSAEVRSDGE